MSRLGKYTRRTFLVASAAVAGGVAFGYYQAKKPLENPLTPQGDAVTLNPYIIIDRSGVTLIAPRAEMGQGIHSTLAALVAEELDVGWNDIRVLHGPPAQAYFNGALMGAAMPFSDYKITEFQHKIKGLSSFLPKMLGLQVTGGSTSVVDAYDKMRLAGATARETLKQAAAIRLNESADTLRTGNGRVLAAGGISLGYTELAADAAAIAPPETVVLRPASNWKYLGKNMPRVDMAAKATGTAEFTPDVRLEGMKFATVRMNPRRSGMARFDSSVAQTMAGVEKIIDLGDGIAVVATNTWLAMQAADAVEIEWNAAAYPATTEAQYSAISDAFGVKPNSVLRDDGDVDAASGTVIEAEYRVPFLAHSTMEPMNATALYTGDALELWAGNQAPLIIQKKAAEAAGLEPDRVVVHTPYMGGGFGRRAEFDYAVLATKVAKEMPGVPVQVMWSRAEDMRHDYYRPAAIARFRGVVKDGAAQALDAKIAGPSVSTQSSKRLAGFALPGADKGHVEGAFDQPYGIPNYRVAGHLADLDVPIGFWRSVGNSFNGFFHESFVDELAHAAGRDPLEFRLQLVAKAHAPSAKVLEAVGEMSGWNGRTANGIGRGVAFTYSFGTPVAQVIEVHDQGGDIRIAKAWIACDVGTALDPRNIEAQMSGGLIYGLSAAVHGEITFADGAVEQYNFPDYDALRMNSAPEIEVRVLENNPYISGVGEPGTPPSMPALANAIFDLTGKRARELPLGKHFNFVS